MKDLLAKTEGRSDYKNFTDRRSDGKTDGLLDRWTERQINCDVDFAGGGTGEAKAVTKNRKGERKEKRGGGEMDQV
jgi:hypothetical protein